jgi:putative ABC transport system ATP-binding protein
MQRVAIARALAMNPSIILADEPTGNVSSSQSNEIMRLFQNLQKRGHTIIMITHEPSVAAFAQRIIYVKDGEIEKEKK